METARVFAAERCGGGTLEIRGWDVFEESDFSRFCENARMGIWASTQTARLIKGLLEEADRTDGGGRGDDEDADSQLPEECLLEVKFLRGVGIDR